jgi:hypothetical protein|tara:strand:- start:95 stop:373 length:279 start_codon:yes stop_codon:yes gene_type:complete
MLVGESSLQKNRCLQHIKKEKVMHIDKYVVNNIGTMWTNGKRKKNQMLGTIDGLDISFKKLVPLLEQWNESVNGEWSDRTIELVINVKENER